MNARKHDLQAVVNAMAKAGGNRAEAARLLGATPSSLQAPIAEAERKGVRPTISDANDPKILRGTIRRLETELKRHQKIGEQSDIVKGVIGTMARRVEELDPPKWVVNGKPGHSSPGVPTLFISDLHWGEVVQPSQINNVNEFNIKIAHERMKVLVDSALQLLKIISTRMDYPGIVVPLGGDLISGNIHDELTATNELNSMPAFEDLFVVLVGVLKALADALGSVFVPCVSGNHGRDTRKIWGKDRHHTSFDWLLCRMLAKHFEAIGDKRITFFIPDGPDAYYKVYDHAYLLTHGDQFRGGDSMIGCLGPILRGDHKKRGRNAQVGMDYDTMIMGHWHQSIFHTRVIVNGSLKGYDEYAYGANFGFEPPCQNMWLTHPKYGHTYRFPVLVGKHEAPRSLEWVRAQGGVTR